MELEKFTCTGCKLSTWSQYDLSDKHHIECPQGGGQWSKSVQQSMHLTAFRRWLWVSVCVHIVTGLVLLFSVFGGR